MNLGLESPVDDGPTLEEVLERTNLQQAVRQVISNGGSAGVDGMTTGQLVGYLCEHWPSLKTALVAGRYQPQPVRRVEIPKPSGGVRQLGIPTVLDRFVQQALMQVLQRYWDPTFSDHSFGFRPGRSAHQAISRAQSYLQARRRWVVDMDLEKFLDTSTYYTPSHAAFSLCKSCALNILIISVFCPFNVEALRVIPDVCTC
mgnify:CR=1 FL=1